MTEAARPLAEPDALGPDPSRGIRVTTGASVRHRAPGTRREGAPVLTVVPRGATAAAGAGGPRRPMHVAVAIGISAGVYAVSLAGVTGLQATSDARIAADRAPAADAVAKLKASHDSMDAGLASLDGKYTDAASSYTAITKRIAGNEKALSQLGKQVKAAEGSASSLNMPTVGSSSWSSSSSSSYSSSLPSVSSSRTVYVSSKPAANACTTASGKPC